jgi:NhaP-type Na+/H+ or K+/H+ antiporter
MISKITDAFPVAGGAGGAIYKSASIMNIFPTMETIVSIILTVTFGAIMGYLVKLLFDWLIKKCQRGNIRKKK